jgi:ubiquinone/menaquinone biosynthesis C-methylase UbiE
MNQEKVWNKIAPEWKKFREIPEKNTIEFLKKQKGNILDLSCGSGRNFTKIDGTIYGVDFSKKMLELAKTRSKEIDIKLIKSKAEKLPFQNNFFDSAIWISALHCIETEKKRKNAISEFYRVLKPNSKARISVWNKDSKRFQKSPKEKLIGWRNQAKRYYYLYEPKEIYKQFEEAGFKILKKEKPEKNIEFIVEKKNKLFL